MKSSFTKDMDWSQLIIYEGLVKPLRIGDEKFVDLPILSCFQCDHIWIPRQDIVRTCPKCKSKHWHLPKKRKPIL